MKCFENQTKPIRASLATPADKRFLRLEIETP